MLAAVWVAIGVALWNALFEMMVVRGVKNVLLRAEQAVSGGRAFPPIREVMDPAIRDAVWVATAWTCVVWLAAAATIHYASAHPRLERSRGPGAGPGAAER